MHDLLGISILPVILTLLAYRAGLFLQQKTKSPLCNPILIAVILVLGFLGISGMELKTYQAGATYLSWLMTPATICLAISFYEQFQKLKDHVGAIFIGALAGTVCSIGFIYLLSRFFSIHCRH